MDRSTTNTVTGNQDLPSVDFFARIRHKSIQRALADPQLPLWPDPVRGVPNSVLRSALFGAIKRGKRRYMEREAIPSLEGISIAYTGLRLDQSDLDVWEGVLHIARLDKLGNQIEFTEKAFLRLIGRGGPNGGSIGKSDREWLRKVFARLTATAIEVTQGPYTYGGSLIDEYFYDRAKRCFVVILNPRMKVIFSRDSWTQVDWSIRHALIGYPLAQWLHGFYSTHANPFRYKVETLRFLCGSNSGESAKSDTKRHKALLGWRDDSLIPALRALERVSNDAGQYFNWEIGGDGLLRVSRTPSTSQLKYLRKSANARPKPQITGRGIEHERRGGWNTTKGG